MTHLELNQEEQNILIDVLQTFLSDLRFEIADTERQAMREPLKQQETVINRILDNLQH